jgi:hypothetical protein
MVSLHLRGGRTSIKAAERAIDKVLAPKKKRLQRPE